jgi:diadenosine tetraphosphate (Ap4A) HIT family hydrolase
MPESGSEDCIFCNLGDSERVVLENDLALAVLDAFPVTEVHALVIPRRHFADFFEMTVEERKACWELLGRMREKLHTQDASITGFNVGVNIGASAGQTVWHCHVHLIPRRDGDMDNPEGGVRGVIPQKRTYREEE